MHPKRWRENILRFTLKELSEHLFEGISTGYISRVERGVQEPSGRIIKLYHRWSNGRVGIKDFGEAE